MRVVLTGFMGAGKTSVGRRLGDLLGIPFVDLDLEIERRAGISIAAIFERAGESEFRRLERELFPQLLALDRAVIAVGGGTLTDPAMLARARERALVVWLNPTFSVIASRIGALGKADRPLFKDEAAAFDLYRQRLASYQAAHLKLDVQAGEDVEQVAARLQLRLAELACNS